MCIFKQGVMDLQRSGSSGNEYSLESLGPHHRDVPFSG